MSSTGIEIKYKDLTIYLAHIRNVGLIRSLQDIIDLLELPTSAIEHIEIKIKDDYKVIKSELDPLP